MMPGCPRCNFRTVGFRAGPLLRNHRVGGDTSNGSTLLTIGYAGGVAIFTEPPRLMVGASSGAIKITGVNLNDRIYTVDFDY